MGKEADGLVAIADRLEKMKALLNETPLGAGTPLTDWHRCLTTMKAIVGNAHNDLGTIA